MLSWNQGSPRSEDRKATTATFLQIWSKNTTMQIAPSSTLAWSETMPSFQWGGSHTPRSPISSTHPWLSWRLLAMLSRRPWSCRWVLTPSSVDSFYLSQGFSLLSTTRKPPGCKRSKSMERPCCPRKNMHFAPPISRQEVEMASWCWRRGRPSSTRRKQRTCWACSLNFSRQLTPIRSTKASSCWLRRKWTTKTNSCRSSQFTTSSWPGRCQLGWAESRTSEAVLCWTMMAENWPASARKSKEESGASMRSDSCD